MQRRVEQLNHKASIKSIAEGQVMCCKRHNCVKAFLPSQLESLREEFCSILHQQERKLYLFHKFVYRDDETGESTLSIPHPQGDPSIRMKLCYGFFTILFGVGNQLMQSVKGTACSTPLLRPPSCRFSKENSLAERVVTFLLMERQYMSFQPNLDEVHLPFPHTLVLYERYMMLCREWCVNYACQHPVEFHQTSSSSFKTPSVNSKSSHSSSLSRSRTTTTRGAVSSAAPASEGKKSGAEEEECNPRNVVLSFGSPPPSVQPPPQHAPAPVVHHVLVSPQFCPQGGIERSSSAASFTTQQSEPLLFSGDCCGAATSQVRQVKKYPRSLRSIAGFQNEDAFMCYKNHDENPYPEVDITYFYRIWKQRVPSLKTRKHNRFAHCDTCTKIAEKMREHKDHGPAALMPFVYERIEHLGEVRDERQAYFYRKRLAKDARGKFYNNVGVNEY